jgi:hypothetical protein
LDAAGAPSALRLSKLHDRQTDWPSANDERKLIGGQDVGLVQELRWNCEERLHRPIDVDAEYLKALAAIRPVQPTGVALRATEIWLNRTAVPGRMLRSFAGASMTSHAISWPSTRHRGLRSPPEGVAAKARSERPLVSGTLRLPTIAHRG